MGTVTFGNIPVDMRVPDQACGMSDIKTALAFMDAFEAVNNQVLASTPSMVAVKGTDANGAVLRVTLFLTGASETSIYLSGLSLDIWDSGYYALYAGNFVLYQNGDILGTVSSVTLGTFHNSQAYVTANGFDIPTDANSSFDPFPYLFANLQGGDVISAGNQSDYLIGFAGNDTLTGNGGNDTLEGKLGNDTLAGGEGIDTAVYTGVAADYTLDAATQWYQATRLANVTDNVSGRDDADALTDVERIRFADANLALDTVGPTSAGGIYRLYQATFDRVPDLGGLGYWIAQADDGESGVQMAEDFTWSQEFQQLYGVSTQDNYLSGANIAELVTGFYQHVLHRAPDQGGLDFYVGAISSHDKTVGRVLAEIADSSENYAATIGQIEDGIAYLPWTA